MQTYTALELANNDWWAANHDATIRGIPCQVALSKNGKVKLIYAKPLPGLRTKKIVRYVEPEKRMLLRSH
jgi:hypothetical protein